MRHVVSSLCFWPWGLVPCVLLGALRLWQEVRQRLLGSMLRPRVPKGLRWLVRLAMCLAGFWMVALLILLALEDRPALLEVPSSGF